MFSWILTLILWIVCSFAQWTCFYAWPRKDQFPRSFRRSAMWFLQCISWNHSQFQIMCMTVQRLGWCQCLACSHLEVGLKIHLSWTFWLLLTFLPENGIRILRHQNTDSLYHKNEVTCAWWAWNISAYFWMDKDNKSSLMQSCLEFVLSEDVK